MEAVDPVFQAKMLDMLKQTGRPEMVVGWYHSHPGFGCWLSGVDINTQQSFEALSSRAVAVVVDPIQSVKGEVCVSTLNWGPGDRYLCLIPLGGHRQCSAQLPTSGVCGAPALVLGNVSQ